MLFQDADNNSLGDDVAEIISDDDDNDDIRVSGNLFTLTFYMFQEITEETIKVRPLYSKKKSHQLNPRVR